MQDVADPCCSQCGYDITGLPGTGKCPECGNRYNMTSGVGIKPAMTDEQRARRMLGRLRTVLLAVAMVMVLICAGFFTRLTQSPWKPISLGILVAFVLLLCVLMSYTNEIDEQP